VDLIFFLAVALSVAAVTPLALPLLGVARDAVPFPSRDSDGVPAREPSQLEVELSVRSRLYGEPENDYPAQPPSWAE
jgi:hypothetical protein